MLKYFKSIYWRFLSAFFFIILLTILLGTAVEYFSTKAELPKLLTEMRTENIAKVLSSVYSRDKNWLMLKQEISRMKDIEMINPSENISIRIIVKDKNGKTLFNSFSDLVQRGNSSLVEGDSVQIIDYDTDESVGFTTLYINRDYLEKKSGEYILALLRPRITQGLITMIAVLFAAAFLSRRITTPIIALTGATRKIAQSRDSSPLPVHSSDEIGQLSLSFNQMIRSLQLQRQLRKRLISDVSHEINTPLNIIRLEAKGLLDKIISPDEAAAHIICEIDNLGGLIHDLDWLAETDSGEFRLKPEICPISEIVKTEVERWRLKGETQNITIALLPLPPDLPHLYIDAVRIGQVLGNLLENALKFIGAKGRITVGCRLNEGEVVISVGDTGPGIAAVDLTHIFDRFYRVDHGRIRTPGGRGLGLSIVKQIVELHGGRVWAESREGRGSCFYFSLPL